MMNSGSPADKTFKDSNLVEDASDGSPTEEPGQLADTFEKLKAHKSTLEAAIAEVCE